MDGLGARRIGFKSRFRLGRHHRCTDRPGGFAGGAVNRQLGCVQLRLVPRAVIDDQHAEYAENRDCNRYRQWPTAVSRGMAPR
jgi:hypothetical protein